MNTVRWLLAFMAMIGPGLSDLWRGRRLLLHLSEPLFAERYERFRDFSTRVLAFGVAGVLFAPPRGVLFFLIGLTLFTLLGRYPAHVRIHDETWSPLAYVTHWLRVILAALGPWLLALLAPAAFRLLGNGWVAAALLIPVGLLWGTFLSRAFARGIGARPLDNPELAGRLEAIVDRSRGPRPSLWAGGPEGGRFVNGVAVPGHPPGVLLTDDLLAELEPDEVDAIFAHEMAHVETFSEWSWRARQFAPAALLTLYPVYRYAVVRFDFEWVSTVAWAAICLLVLALVSVGTRSRETEADLRAFELTGDADALIRALEKLHEVARLPRRKAREVEQRQTHPTLENRIRALREAAGGQAQTSTELGDVVARGPDPDRAAIVGAHQIEWLDGLSVASSDPSELRIDAGRIQTVRYGELVELRMDARGSKPPFLIARDRWGGTQRMELDPDVAGAVDAALHRAEPLLGEWTAALSGQNPRLPVIRLAAALTILAALLVGPAWGVLLAGLAVLAWPSSFSMVVAGVAALVRGGATLSGVAAWSGETVVPILLLSLLGLLFLVLWLRRRSLAVPSLSPGEWRPVVVLAGIALLTTLLMMLRPPGGFLWMGSHLWVRSVPTAVVLIAGLTVAGLVAAPRRYRGLAGAGALLLLIAGMVGSSGFRSAGTDVLGQSPATLPVQFDAWTASRSFTLPGRPHQLRLAPDGERVALVVATGPELSPTLHTHIVSEDGQVELSGSWPVWTGPSTLALLDPLLGHLTHLDVVSLDSVSVALTVNQTENRLLFADSVGWRLLPAYSDGSELDEIRGQWEGDSIRTRRWSEAAELHYFVEAAPLPGGETLFYATTFDSAFLLAGFPALSSRPGTRLWLGKEGGLSPLGATALWLSCAPLARSAMAQCATQQGPESEVWTWDAASGFQPTGRVEVSAGYPEFLSSGVRLVRYVGTDVLVDPVRREAWWFPETDAWALAADYRDGVLALAFHQEPDRVRVEIYRH